MSVKAYITADKKTSKTSTAPYNKDDLNDLLAIVKEIGVSLRGTASPWVSKSAALLKVSLKTTRSFVHKTSLP